MKVCKAYQVGLFLPQIKKFTQISFLIIKEILLNLIGYDLNGLVLVTGSHINLIRK